MTQLLLNIKPKAPKWVWFRGHNPIIYFEYNGAWWVNMYLKKEVYGPFTEEQARKKVLQLTD